MKHYTVEIELYCSKTGISIDTLPKEMYAINDNDLKKRVENMVNMYNTGVKASYKIIQKG